MGLEFRRELGVPNFTPVSDEYPRLREQEGRTSKLRPNQTLILERHILAQPPNIPLHLNHLPVERDPMNLIRHTQKHRFICRLQHIRSSDSPRQHRLFGRHERCRPPQRHSAMVFLALMRFLRLGIGLQNELEALRESNSRHTSHNHQRKRSTRVV